MKVLILSCNTGEGHNVAGKAMKEALEKEGHEAVMLDYMKLSSDRTSRVVAGAYINLVKYTPHFFYLLYKTVLKISSDKRKSPVYYANSLMAKHLKKYLEENKFDIILMPHIFPAETITYMKKKQMIDQKTIAISTDYTCIPFWEETECDAYVIPHERMIDEYIKRGIPKEKLYPLGIPVRQDFYTKEEIRKAKKKLNLNIDKPMYLIMSGSMGFGKIQLFTIKLNRQCEEGEQIIVICGNNKKLKSVLEKEFKNRTNIKIVGYTDNVSVYMDAADVVYTKPGGLTSTEVIIKNRPLVHTAPIPGCETKNMQFFMEKGMSLHSKKITEQIEQGKILLYNNEIRKNMLENQRENSKINATRDIIKLMESLVNKEKILFMRW
ncbi:glycosyltransferase [Clostridium sp. AL.422]|uniref:MGDG synthase family glycosyltransferase n=1 Tax=Clostridium TaxID=1485 RepID=UPI00293DFDF2|nr:MULTISPECIES: glycosyltransferase [unclassified Clostridium]MDV4149592.1 glycosyltransferase [Clostridium sp. AL.422]